MIRGDGPLVIIPAYNEERTVGSVVEALVADGFRILVIDDGSVDQTSAIARSFGATVLRLPINLGVGGALRAGFRYAIANGYISVIQIDADGQHPVSQISDLLSAGEASEAHLIIGSRYLSVDATHTPSFPRRLSMRLLSAVASHFAGVRLTDTTSGFRLIRQPLLAAFAEEFPNYYLGDTYEATVAAVRGGYKVVEIPAALAPRLHGSSSVTTGRAIGLIAKVLIITLTGLHPKIRPIPSGASIN